MLKFIIFDGIHECPNEPLCLVKIHIPRALPVCDALIFIMVSEGNGPFYTFQNGDPARFLSQRTFQAFRLLKKFPFPDLNGMLLVPAVEISRDRNAGDFVQIDAGRPAGHVDQQNRRDENRYGNEEKSYTLKKKKRAGFHTAAPFSEERKRSLLDLFPTLHSGRQSIPQQKEPSFARLKSYFTISEITI